MTSVNHISLERVISGIYRDLKPLEEVQENDLVEWAGEALDYIGAYPQYQEVVDYVTVEGHLATIPCGLHKIVSIAYKTGGGDSSGCAIKISSSDSDTSTCVSSTCNCGESTDPCSNTSTTTDTIVTQTQQLIDYHLQYRFTKTSYFYQNYKPLRLASSNFAISKTAHCEDCINISATCKEEYSVADPYIKTSFKTGELCIAYLKQPVDDKGWPMIPEEVSYIEAVKRYIIYKMKYSEMIAGKFPANLFTKLEDDWHWYCQQARGKAYMPDTIDKMQNLLEQRQRLLPAVNRYYGFFGKLADKEHLALQGKYNV